ncbi:MAG: hypothetical protein PHS60_14005, partial [Zavarzinia sp.]|nr:hypothetical protein [Zavarzinia sp.]
MRDTLPDNWGPVETTDRCSWIDGAYEAWGHKTDDAGLHDAPATIPLFTAILPYLIDQVEIDYEELAKVERVTLHWAPGEGGLSITPVGGALKPEVLDYACDAGHLVLRLTGPTLEKDWVGVGGEDIELWQDGEGGLVV